MAAVCAAQLPVAGALAMVASFGANSYGQGFSPMGLACVLIFGPVLFPFLGWGQVAALALPARLVGELLARRIPRARLLGVLAVAAVWAGVLVALGISWYGPDLLACVLLCAAPVYVVDRPWGWLRRRVRLWSAALFGGGLVAVLTVLGGGVAQSAGLLPTYEPPVLTHAELAGEWRDPDDGAVLRLGADGRARLTRVPAGTPVEADALYTRCTGSGTWTEGVGRAAGDAGVELDVPACPDGAVSWTIAGTHEHPELYVLFGDPDSGDLHILRRQ
jgi:hypothetical protein